MLILYIILGFIQGFTEPIPVSSSGHLVIFKNLFHLDALNDLNLEIFTNFGSFLAIVFIFRKDLIKLIQGFFGYIKTKSEKYKNDFRYCLFIIIGSIPAGIAGLLLKDVIEKYLSNVKYVGVALFVTALFLFIIRKMKGYKTSSSMMWVDAFKIGLFQVVALFPGISRSGATLVGGMFSGLKREDAFKFSFMLYLPISLATLVLGVKDTVETGIDSAMIINYVCAATVSLIVTFFSTKWFKDIMMKGKLIYFVYYCLAAGAFVLIFL